MNNDISLYFPEKMSYRIYINFREAIRRNILTNFVIHMIDKLAIWVTSSTDTKINSDNETTLLNCVMKYHHKFLNFSEHLSLYKTKTNEPYGNICVNGHDGCNKCCENTTRCMINSKGVVVSYWNNNDILFPVQFATHCYSYNIVKYMVMKGANLNLINEYCILHSVRNAYPRSYGSHFTKSYNAYKMIDLLLQYTIQPNAKYICNINEYDLFGYTALYYGLKSKNVYLIELLIRHKANANLKHNKKNSTTIDMLLYDLTYCIQPKTQDFNVMNQCILILKMLFDNGLKLEYTDALYIQKFAQLANFLKQKQISQLEPLMSLFVLPIVLNNIIFDYAW